MGIEATGTIHVIYETKQVSERFSKREFVLELTDNPKYPQLVQFQCTGDRCAQLDEFSEGDQVRVDFSLRGREWRSPKGETKYFNTLDVWKIEPLGERKERRGKKRDEAPSGGNGDPFAPPRPGDVDDIPFIACDMACELSWIPKVLR